MFVTLCILQLHFGGRVQDLTIHIKHKIKNFTVRLDQKNLKYFVLPNAVAVQFNKKPNI